jgi:pimeloyl-ACP methyl ester carboxylesterase
MPYTDIQGVPLYYETEGQGLPLVLGHGGGDSLEMWRRTGYTDQLRNNFQLVLLDFPGNGRSQQPDGLSRQQIRTSDAVLAVLDTLNIEKAHYFGYSAGASAGFNLALHHPERFNSFILGGMTPYAWPETMVKAVKISIELYRMLLESPELYLMRMSQMLGRPLTSEDREHFLNQDAEARIAGLTALIEGPVFSDQDLANISTPCLIYCGDLDPFHAGAKLAAEHVPGSTFLSLPGLNHITALAQKNLVLPRIIEFLTYAIE